MCHIIIIIIRNEGSKKLTYSFNISNMQNELLSAGKDNGNVD